MLNVIFNNLSDTELAKAIANGLSEHIGLVKRAVDKMNDYGTSEEDKHRVRFLGDLCEEWERRQDVKQAEGDGDIRSHPQRNALQSTSSVKVESKTS